MNKILKLGGHSVEITHPERVMFPKDHILKVDVIEYYKNIAPFMLPHMKGRPVTMLRYPEGIYGESFYQKDTPDYFPSWIKRVTVKKEGGVVHHVLCDNAATLVYLANQGCLTPHLWLSKVNKINFPDRLIIDLDPSGDNFSLVRNTALVLKDLFEELGLVPFVMTTGSRGLHVVVPLKPTADFETMHDFARDVAKYLAQHNPKTLTTEIRKAKRRGRLFLDSARNAYSQTGVSAYAIRAKPGAPVATPLHWEEVEDRKLTAQRYTIKNIFKRLEKIDDPWSEINKHAKTLNAARKKISSMLSE